MNITPGMRRFLAIFVLFTLGGNGTLAGPRHAAAAAPATQPAFVIGVWQQPQENFATWKARGCNTLVEIPTGDTWTPAAQAQWVAAAEAAQLWQIRVPVGALAADNLTPHLIAWNQPDEPERTGHAAAELAANYTNYKAAAPARPVFINFDGSRVIGIQGGLTQANYKPYLAVADQMGSDVYPNDWGLPAPKAGQPSWLTYPGAAVAQLSSWSGGKPQIVFIETSNQQRAASLTPTPAQVRYETWHAVLSGALGVTYFPQQFGGGGFAFDGTTPEIAAALPVLNAELAAIGPYVGGGLKPGAVAPGFEYGSATAAAGELRVLLNATDAAQVYAGVTFAPWGAYAVLVAKGGNKVLVQTSPPQTVDQRISALQTQQAEQQILLQQHTTALKAIAKAATQP